MMKANLKQPVKYILFQKAISDYATQKFFKKFNWLIQRRIVY